VGLCRCLAASVHRRQCLGGAGRHGGGWFALVCVGGVEVRTRGRWR
jgi:hypothetical protein